MDCNLTEGKGHHGGDADSDDHERYGTEPLMHHNSRGVGFIFASGFQDDAPIVKPESTLSFDSGRIGSLFSGPDSGILEPVGS